VLTAVLLFAFLQSDNVELAAMKKVDQTDRAFVTSPQEIDWEKISVRDAYRQQRVRVLLQDGEVKTARDFDNAALIMQHGNKPSDYLLAHELGSIAGYLGAFGSLPALAEDRWLESLGRKQRWGSQFKWDGSAKPIDKQGAVVTDHMRKDMFLPALADVARLGMQATMADIEKRAEYLEKRMDASLWENAFPSKATVSVGLAAVRRNELNSADDYVNAAEALSKSRDSQELLLAHELSMVAMLRRSPRAPQVFTRTLDAYLAAIGVPKRYATGSISRSSARMLGL